MNTDTIACRSSAA